MALFTTWDCAEDIDPPGSAGKPAGLPLLVKKSMKDDTARFSCSVIFKLKKDMSKKCGCAVLAGGAGRRMGQVNKAELELEGHSFLSHICAEFEKAGFKGYISVANYDQMKPEGWTLVKDCVTNIDGGFIGPIGGIYSCLAQADRDGFEGLFFAPCDAPFFNNKLVKEICNIINSFDCYDAAVLKTLDGKIHPTFGWYSVETISILEEAIGHGKYRLTSVLKKMNAIEIAISEIGLDDSVLTNINNKNEFLSIKTAAEEKK